VHTHHPLRVGLHQSVDSQTHTMVGTKSDAGIMIRTVRTILDMVHSMPSVSSTPRSFSPRRQSPRRSPCPRKSGQRGRVSVSMLEIYGNKIYDLSVRAAADTVVWHRWSVDR
jgi:hypothetical protein